MLSKAMVWGEPTCPFEIEIAAEKLEEIRLAVVEGFYAVPRGGIEIGGVLFGVRDGNRVAIQDFRLIECEHKTGPSFTLSDKDTAALKAMLASNSTQVVGWFHSHTRSEICLSPADLDLYNRFFPEAWQVALVLRPANMLPTRAGYFFRDAEGKIAAEKSAREFVIEGVIREEQKKPRVAAAAVALANGLPASPVPTEAKAAEVKPAPQPVAEAKPAEKPAPIVAAPEPQANYSDLENEMITRRQGSWMWIAGLCAVLILAICAYVTRGAWLPQEPPPLKLQASDVDGKLFIRWNPVQNTDGKLTITDGGKPSTIALDSVQVSRGFYVYARQSEKTILRMKVGAAEDLTTFAGPLQPKGPTPEEIQKAKEAEKVKADLQDQTLRNRQLQRKVKELNNKLLEPKP